MQERKERGLCYNCDEKFQPGHKCSRPRLFLLEGVELDELEEIQVEEVFPKEETEAEPQEAELLGISLHALHALACLGMSCCTKSHVGDGEDRGATCSGSH
jgi:hypothetical protein